MPEFKDKLVFITGAARGLGRGMAFEYAKQGASLVITDVLGDQLKQTAEDLKKEGYTVHDYYCDIASDKEVHELGEKVKKEVGVPDILHNNAMWSHHGSMDHIDIDVVRKAFEINVLGYLRVVKVFLDEMKERKSGWIVNTASPNGIAPPKAFAIHGVPYNMTKAADISMSQSLKATLEKYNIGVSVLYPGAVWTGASDRPHTGASQEFMDAVKKFFVAKAVQPEVAARDLLAGVKAGKFFVTSFGNFENVLVEFAQNGMDPLAQEYAWED